MYTLGSHPVGLYQQPQGYRNPVRKIMSEPNLAEEPTFVLQQHTARPAHGVGDSTSESSISHPQPLSRLSGTKVNSDAGDGGQASRSSAVHEASAEFVAAEAGKPLEKDVAVVGTELEHVNVKPLLTMLKCSTGTTEQHWAP